MRDASSARCHFTYDTDSDQEWGNYEETLEKIAED